MNEQEFEQAKLRKQQERFTELLDEFNHSPQQSVSKIIRRTTMSPPETAIIHIVLFNYRRQLLRQLEATDSAIAGTPTHDEHLLKHIAMVDHNNLDIAEAAKMVLHCIASEPDIKAYDISKAHNFEVREVIGDKALPGGKRCSLQEAFTRVSMLAAAGKKGAICLDEYLLYETGKEINEDE